MKNSHSWINSLLIISFSIVLIYSLWTATIGWNTPINQEYDFVQAKAAMGTYYMAKGGPILRVELPIFGPPWFFPQEFPFYQLTSAWIYKLTGMPLESAGRLTSKIFFYFSCIPLFLIAMALGFRKRTALIPLTLFLASPLYLFWSRQFMIECTAIFFGLSYLAAVMLWKQKPSELKLVLAVLLGMAAALAKSTTYPGFAAAVGIYLAVEVFRKRSYSLAHLARCFALLVIPLIAGVLWLRYTDGVKSLSPLAATFTSDGVGKWFLFSGLQDRLQPDLWYHFFRITLHDSIGHRAVWILSIILALSLGKKAWLYWICSGLFLIAPLLFPQVHLHHDYYACANAVFMVFAVAALVECAVSSDKKWTSVLGALLFVLVIGYEVREFMNKGYYQQQERKMEPILFAKKLQSVVAADDVLLMYGEDWCPVIPYYAERRAIMMANEHWYNPGLKDSLAMLKAEGKKVGAIVLCYGAKTDPELRKHLSLGPLLLRDTCDVYAYRL